MVVDFTVKFFVNVHNAFSVNVKWLHFKPPLSVCIWMLYGKDQLSVINEYPQTTKYKQDHSNE